MSSHLSSTVPLVNPLGRERTSCNIQALVELLSHHLSFSDLIRLREFVRESIGLSMERDTAVEPSALKLGSSHSLQLSLNPRALLECLQRAGLFEDNEPSGTDIIRNFLKSINRFDLLSLCTFRSPLPVIDDPVDAVVRDREAIERREAVAYKLRRLVLPDSEEESESESVSDVDESEEGRVLGFPQASGVAASLAGASPLVEQSGEPTISAFASVSSLKPPSVMFSPNVEPSGESSLTRPSLICYPLSTGLVSYDMLQSYSTATPAMLPSQSQPLASRLSSSSSAALSDGPMTRSRARAVGLAGGELDTHVQQAIASTTKRRARRAIQGRAEPNALVGNGCSSIAFYSFAPLTLTPAPFNGFSALPTLSHSTASVAATSLGSSTQVAPLFWPPLQSALSASPLAPMHTGTVINQCTDNASLAATSISNYASVSADNRASTSTSTSTCQLRKSTRLNSQNARTLSGGASSSAVPPAPSPPPLPSASAESQTSSSSSASLSVAAQPSRAHAPPVFFAVYNSSSGQASLASQFGASRTSPEATLASSRVLVSGSEPMPDAGASLQKRPRVEASEPTGSGAGSQSSLLYHMLANGPHRASRASLLPAPLFLPHALGAVHSATASDAGAPRLMMMMPAASSTSNGALMHMPVESSAEARAESGASRCCDSPSTARPQQRTRLLGTAPRHHLTHNEPRKRAFAEVRVRVRAECAESATTLESVASEKMSELERRLDRFAQANSILRARELAGNLVLSLRLGELPALEALARDASDGRLLHSLSRVFLADSLRSTLNNEPLRLMVALDDDDYENARCTLAQNI